MLNKKRTKMSRSRGSNSHGGGHKKKRRGSGHRGGFGMSGTGARGDQKKTMILKKYGNTYFGKRGFVSISKQNNNVLSLNYIEDNFDKMIETGMIVKEGKEFIFDSTLYKYDKILGKGQFSKKLTIICDDISASARQRVEDAGGKVVLTFEDDSAEFEDSPETAEE